MDILWTYTSENLNNIMILVELTYIFQLVKKKKGKKMINCEGFY